MNKRSRSEADRGLTEKLEELSGDAASAYERLLEAEALLATLTPSSSAYAETAEQLCFLSRDVFTTLVAIPHKIDEDIWSALNQAYHRVSNAIRVHLDQPEVGLFKVGIAERAVTVSEHAEARRNLDMTLV